MSALMAFGGAATDDESGGGSSPDLVLLRCFEPGCQAEAGTWQVPPIVVPSRTWFRLLSSGAGSKTVHARLSSDLKVQNRAPAASLAITHHAYMTRASCQAPCEVQGV